jgi:exopolyphosphatase/guanosine-5'-triphosphate,3'-diphosphate pyrophosphatase
MTTDVTKSVPRTADERPAAVKTVAVIDIGTTSIRMAIAEIDTDGAVRTLDKLSQAVHLGRDTFTRGSIDKATIEECVRILKSYRQVLGEYRVTQTDQIRVVATSAVREATNRLAFIDRIFSATGFQVEPIDEAEANRITYLSIQPLLADEPELTSSPAVIVEVGGGNTEVLVVQGTDVLFAQTYRLGSIRLREMLDAYRTPRVKLRHIMQSHILRTVEEIVQNVPTETSPQLFALGGDVRFAASKLLPDWTPETLGRIPISDFARFTDRMLSMTEDEIVEKFHLTYPDAETLGPALLAYLDLATALKLDHILISNVNLRDGLLHEFALQGQWTEEFNEQIVRSARALGRKFGFDEEHATHVADLSHEIFQQMQDEHGLTSRHRLILYVAALLHEIGLFIGTSAYHKHSMYLIRHSELFGLSKNDVLLVSLVARYHRRASPKSNHEGYNTLDREQRIAVCKLASMLRVADALDHSHSGRVGKLRCRRDKSRLVITVPNVDDLSLEQLALQQKGPLFEEIFGLQVLLRTG